MDESEAGLRGKTKGIGKIQIEGNQISGRLKTGLVKILVHNPAQILHEDRVGIMSPLRQEVPTGQGQVFVEFEIHEPVASKGMGMTCSRVISAA